MLNKDYKIITGCLIAILLLISITGAIVFTKYFIPYSSPGIEVTILNNTGTTVSGLKITYEHSSRETSVPSISSHGSCRLTIIPTEEFAESSMALIYSENQGKRHNITIIGYFEKNNANGTVRVDINTIDQYGVMDMDVKSSLG